MNGIDQTTLAIDIGLFVVIAAIAALVMLLASNALYHVRRARRRKQNGQELRDYCKRTLRQASEAIEPGYPKTEVIQCPECGTNQPAQIEFQAWMPWPVYFHRCIHCDYIITESDWQVVQPDNTLERKGGAE